MKKFKKFSVILTILILFVGILGAAFIPTGAQVDANIKDENIVYRAVDKVINISDKKVCDITETLTVRFKESGINLGLTRNVSRLNKITRIVNGKKYVTTTENKFKLISVTVDGVDEYHFTESDSEYFYIMTGADNDYKDAGVYTYKFNYLLDMGEDFIKDFDDFTFDLMDYDFGSSVEKFSASVTLPHDFFEEGQNPTDILSFRTNRMEGLGLAAVDAKIEGRTITCHYDNGLRAGNGITMQLILPNKYFNTKYTPAPFYYVLPVVLIISSIGVALLVLFGLVRNFSKRGIIITPEFYPPKGFSPFDVARAYRGHIKAKDFASLVLDWAAKGLVKIDVKSKTNVVLTKLKDFPELDRNDENYTTRSHEKKYFEALFKKSDTYSTKESRLSHNSNISSAITRIYDHDDDARKPTKVCRAIGHVFAMLPWIFYILWYGISVSSSGFIMFFISLFITIGIFVFLYTPLPIVFKLVWCGGFMGIPIAMLNIIGFTTVYDINGYATIAFVMFFVLHVLSRFIYVRTKKYDKYRGQVLGFKNFLVKAQLSELEMLISENPEYYYDILPYCYIFGITKKMEEKFKALHVPPPVYCSDGVSTTVLCHSLAHSMSHSISHSSGGRSGGFGGGGGGSHGSSGGGGGGGGSHGR